MVLITKGCFDGKACRSCGDVNMKTGKTYIVMLILAMGPERISEPRFSLPTPST